MRSILLLLCIFHCHVALRYYVPTPESASSIFHRELAGFSLMVNSRDVNGFFRIMSVQESQRWPSVNEFFERFRARKLHPIGRLVYTPNGGVFGTVQVSKRIDGLPGFRMNMVWNRNAANRWVVQQLVL